MCNKKPILLIFLVIFMSGCGEADKERIAKELVYKHAKAWETGNYELLNSVLHDDVVFAYPGRRLNKQETLADLIDYNKSFRDTKIYINKIIIEGDNLAVEWQFASTNIKTGNRTAVSDAIVGKIKDGKFVVWKEYLDGRVSRMQATGELPLEEGQEPFPWPRKK
ncbi:nuclear transport factor 2 family protein [Candidatus Woesearchaeota archaeon]|nr:nuclear transport factor 2 family protein [Candidatus Woesearchaeota archaeon]